MTDLSSALFAHPLHGKIGCLHQAHLDNTIWLNSWHQFDQDHKYKCVQIYNFHGKEGYFACITRILYWEKVLHVVIQLFLSKKNFLNGAQWVSRAIHNIKNSTDPELDYVLLLLTMLTSRHFLHPAVWLIPALLQKIVTGSDRFIIHDLTS